MQMSAETGSVGMSVEEINQLEDIILSKIQQRTPPRMNEDNYIIKTFRHHDLGNTGWCEFDKFQRALLPFASGISEQDLHMIFQRYAPEGSLYYKNFAIEFVNGTRRQQALEPEATGGQWENVEDTLIRIKCFLYNNGPAGIISLAAAFRDADPQNLRCLSGNAFQMVMANFFEGTPCPLTDEHIDQLLQVFMQAYSSIAYDEFLLALKEEPGPDRRAHIRAAFRRLDAHSEGLVDIMTMIRAFNANRHPQVCDGLRKPEEVLNEFAETLKDLVAFRRGQQSYPTNLVAWEEFEDYYKFINGCFDTDDMFCSMLQKVWDLDKVPNNAVEARTALAAPAAGIPAKSRTGLHHWQANTLPTNAQYRNLDAAVNLDEVLSKKRGMIARRGLRAAIDVVKNFYHADDDLDELLDVYEFRRACQHSSLAYSDAEEACIFEACGVGPPGNAHRHGKIQVPCFLQMLHGPLNQTRSAHVKQAFASLGGDPTNEDSVVSPAVLKDNFACEAHPAVARGEADPATIMTEFLDTFSLLAHVRGGCQDAKVAFSDFMAYYEVVSSVIDNDAYFVLLINRLWSLSDGLDTEGEGDGGSTVDFANGTGSPRSPRRGAPEMPVSPMAEPRPPTFDGPSAYSTSMVHDNGVDMHQTHRRFMRKDGDPSQSAPSPTSGFSPITKSSIVFNEMDSAELNSVINRLLESIGRRGIKGWTALVQRFQQNDHRKNGTIMRLDWQRVHKSLGFGLSTEEKEHLYKALAANRRDGAMDYAKCIRLLKGTMPPKRQALVSRLFEALQDPSSGTVPPIALKQCYDARSTPACMIAKKDVMQATQEFHEAVDFFGGSTNFDLEAFLDFFAMISAIHPEEDEFRLYMTHAFGLS